MNRKDRTFAIAAAAILLPFAATPAAGQYVYNPANGHYYTLTALAASQAGCRTQAVNLGGELVSIGDAAEQAFVASAFASTLATTALWIGASDAGTEGVWLWDDGTPYAYANWHAGEPNNAGNEDGATMLTNANLNRWNDEPTLNVRRGIVEIDALAVGDAPGTAPTVAGSSIVAYQSTGFVVPGAAAGTAAPCSNNNVQTVNDYWIRYEAATTGVLTISNCPSSAAAPGGFTTTTADTFLAVFTADANPPSNVVTCAYGSPQCGGVQSEVGFAVVAGGSYYVQVGPADGVSPIAGSLAFDVGIANDFCAGALPLSLGVNGPFDNSEATDLNSSFGCAPSAHDVWFSYTSPAAAALSVTTATPPGATPGTLVDPNLHVFAACGGALIACVDDNPNVPLTAKFDVAAGQTVYVRVSGWLFDVGTFHLTVGSEDRVLRLSSPAGPGSLKVENLFGQPFETYFTVFTLNAGAYPNGWYYGVEPTLTEYLIQLATFAPPFVGALDATGSSSFGPLLGAPPITLYAATAFFAPTGAFSGASAPVAYTIP